MTQRKGERNLKLYRQPEHGDGAVHASNVTSKARRTLAQVNGFAVLH